MGPTRNCVDGTALSLPDSIQRYHDLGMMLRPRDPFHRTASELRLCEMAVNSDFEPLEKDVFAIDDNSPTKQLKGDGSPATSRLYSWIPSFFSKVDDHAIGPGEHDAIASSSHLTFMHPQTAALLKGVSLDDSVSQDMYISGSIVLSGNFQEHTATICDALRVALLEIAAPTCGTDLVLTVWRGDDFAASHDQVTTVERTTKDDLIVDYQSYVKFSFECILMDPFLKGLVIEALSLESANAGALKSMPSLAESLGDAVSRLTIRLEVDP